MNTLTTYESVLELIQAEQPQDPVICIIPDRIAAQVKLFADGFPGRVLFPVKTNHDDDVLKILWNEGIRHFDTASISEIERVRRLFPSAGCYFNHPVKPVYAIKRAYEEFGVLDYVVDHMGELMKLKAILPAKEEIIVQVRLAPHNPDAEIDFSKKFGAEREQAVELLNKAREIGFTTAISFHTGWQTTEDDAYADVIAMANAVMSDADAKIAYVNVGGGFPSHFKAEPLANYFETIKSAMARYPRLADVPLYCEPGSATVTYGQGMLVRVELRKENRIYLNDGIYGGLNELTFLDDVPPITPYSVDGVIEGNTRDFITCGPTCDSEDMFKQPFTLPEEISTGDWIFIENTGSYSNVLITPFNGFNTHGKVIVTSP